MKVKIILFVIVLLLVVVNLTYGQVSKENYEKAVDYLNCKTVELSLKEFNKVYYTGYLNEVACDSGNISFEAINDYLIKNKIQKTFDLSNEINNLKRNSIKNGWQATDATQFLSEDVFNNKNYKELNYFASQRKDNANFSSLRKLLSEKLILILSGGQKIVPPQGGDSNPKTNSDVLDDQTKTRVDKDKSDSSEISDWMFIIFFILAAIVIGLAIYFFLIADNPLNLLRGRGNYVRRFPSEKIYLPKPNSRATSSDIEILHNKIKELGTVVEDLKGELKGEIETLKKELRTIPQNEIVTPKLSENRSRRDSNQEVFYLSIPNEDGNFYAKHAHPTYKEGTSIYRFTKTSPNQAVFQIDERETSIRQALQYPDKNIDPVCEANNAFNREMRRIITLKDNLGKAVLDGDKWKVTRKAKIRYEN